MLKCGFVFINIRVKSNLFIFKNLNNSARNYVSKKITGSKLWRILFFGSDNFSLESLKILHDY